MKIMKYKIKDYNYIKEKIELLDWDNLTLYQVDIILEMINTIEYLKNLLEGKSWVYSTGGRSQRAKLLRLPKEQLVRIIYLQNNDIKKASKLLESKGESNE